MKKIIHYYARIVLRFTLRIEKVLFIFLKFIIIPDLDSPVSNLSIEGRRFITQKLNGKFHDGEQVVFFFFVLAMIPLCLALVWFNNQRFSLRNTVTQQLQST